MAKRNSSWYYEQQLNGSRYFSKSDEYRCRTMAYFVLVTLNQFMRLSYTNGEPYSSFAFNYVFKNIRKSDVTEARERAMKTIEKLESTHQGLMQSNDSH